MPTRPIAAALAMAAFAAPVLADASAAGGVLLISLDEGNHDVTITIEDGRVELDGVPGVAPGTAFSAIEQVNYVALRGNNTVVVMLSTDRDLSIAFDCEHGATDVQVVGDADGASVELDVELMSGPGSDTLALDLDSSAALLSVSLIVNPGPGSVWVTGTIDSPAPSVGLDVALSGVFSGGSDTLQLDVASNASSPALIFDLNTAGGADDVAIAFDQQAPAALQCLGVIDLGNGPDSLAMALGGPGSSVTMLGQARGQNSADTMAVDVTGSLMTTFLLLGGNGPDAVTTTSTGSMAGTPLLSGGKAWDTLTIAAGGAQLAVPRLNGGPGYDTAVGFGTIEECEVVNP